MSVRFIIPYPEEKRKYLKKGFNAALSLARAQHQGRSEKLFRAPLTVNIAFFVFYDNSNAQPHDLHILAMNYSGSQSFTTGEISLFKNDRTG